MGQSCNRLSRGGVVDVCIHSKEQSKESVDQLNANNLQWLSVLGVGNYSVVQLARLPSGRVTAVKVMNKAHISKTKQVTHAFNEKRILKLMNSPFIVDFLGTMQDDRNIYCLMEFVQGGELFRYMCQKERLTFSETQFYCAEISLAICHLHAIRCVYRDLKPENVLLTTTGHIKLVDLGFGKPLSKGERTYTVCGTPEYLAPEVIEQVGYDLSADWWQVGVLLYEMLAGRTPFADHSPYLLYEKILTASLEFPRSGFSEEARDLISRLLKKDPKKRLKEDEILGHPFFKEIDWEDARALRLRPPFTPTVRSADDTSYFETMKVKEKWEATIDSQAQRAFREY